MTVKIKMVATGDGEVGKTALLMTFATRQFPGLHVPTVFETYTATVACDDVQVELGMFDTAGQEDYDRLRPLSYAGVDVVLICFSLAHRVSFNNVLNKWYPEAKHFCPTVPIVLVGNKADLRNGAGLRDEVVTTDEGKKLAKKIGAKHYHEISAKNASMQDLETLFAAVVRSVIKKRKESCRVM